MTDTTCHLSLSLDGYVAGPDQSLADPLGRGVDIAGGASTARQVRGDLVLDDRGRGDLVPDPGTGAHPRGGAPSAATSSTSNPASSSR